MGFDPAMLVIIAVILTGSAVLCTSVGFGFGIFANSLMVLAGVPLHHAMAVSVLTMVAQSGTALYRLREHIPYRAIMPLIGLGVLSMPAGTYLLKGLSGLDKPTVQAVVGLVVLGVVIVQMLLRVRPRDSLHPGWTVTAGLSYGVLAGMVGMGGPPVVLWVMAHRWSNPQTRTALWFLFLAMVPMQLLLLSIAFSPTETAWAVLKGGLMVPMVLAGTALGLRLGASFSRRTLGLLANALLVATSLAMIVTWAVSRGG